MSAPRKAAAFLAISFLTFLSASRVDGDGTVRLQGHTPSAKQLRSASYLGEVDGAESVKLAVVLRARNQIALDDFLKRVQDPQDAEFHKFLSPAQFAERFGPTDADVKSVTDHFVRYGVRVAGVHPNHLVVDLEGSAAQVEDAVQVRMQNYRLESGRVARSMSSDPLLPADVATKIHAVAGLNNFVVRRPHVAHAKGMRALDPRGTVGDFLTPAKIKSAYSLDTVAQTGTGETIALFELDGYTASDVTAYATYFSLPAPNLQNVLVDGYSGAAGNGAIEVTLDIQLALAIAPAAKVMVYEGPNTDTGVLDTYSKIASDNLAPTVSSSWGSAEDENTSTFLNAENTIFQQMAAQGQSMFAASGDNGAYDDASHPTTLSVDDPSSQPYVTGVGGTTLLLTTANSYHLETAWGSNGSGGGGGVSHVWSIPSWQVSVGTSSNGESTTKRMVPDVSLDANPNTGYPVYMASGGGWELVGGTSCAAPMWAAFFALVNQKRVADGHARIGQANPAIYSVAKSTQYPLAFHDVNDGSTNLAYAASEDYDLATGWGSFNGSGLFTNLTAASLPAPLLAPGAPATLQVSQ
jgi:subtilase family serine protease